MNSKLDEIERSIFRIKVAYEKYFNGIERFEPLKELEDLKRTIRDIMVTPIRNTQQRYRFTQLKARLSSLEMYWRRNVSQMERGVHPKQVFRANLKNHSPKKRSDYSKNVVKSKRWNDRWKNVVSAQFTTS